LELSQKAHSKETEGDAHNYLSQLDYFQGYLKRALDHAEASIRCLREIGNPTRLAWALIFKGLILCDLKREDDYRDVKDEAKVWTERSGNDRVRCLFNNINFSNFLKTGEYEVALKGALEGLELAERIDEGIQTVFLLSYAGLAALYAGKSEYALNLLQRGELEGERVGHPLGMANLRLALAETLLRLGRAEDSIKPAEAALQFCQELDLGHTLQRALEINAEILANMVPMDETRIDKMMEQAAALVERSDSPWYRIKHLMAQARVSLKRDRIKVARESLNAARILYQKMGLENGTEELRSLEETLRKQETERR
jgi:tetratricopeptide (TPR) repeat protein